MAFEGPAESVVDEESDTGATHAGKAVSDEKSENVSGELVMGGSQVVNAVNEGKDNERPGAPLAVSDENGNIMEIIDPGNVQVFFAVGNVTGIDPGDDLRASTQPRHKNNSSVSIASISNDWSHLRS